MSEDHDYTLRLRVEMTGYDTRRYAVVHADSTLSLTVQSSGFRALLLGLRDELPTVKVNMAGDAVTHYAGVFDGRNCLYRSVAVNRELLEGCLGGYGISRSSSEDDSLLLVLTERASRRFRPDISGVEILFSDGYALYGSPKVEPAEVTLYGSPEALAKVTSLKAKAMTLANISLSDVYTVPLDDSWKQEGDIYASTEELKLFIPVEKYVERQYTLPVTVDSPQPVANGQQLRLYPDNVTLRVWVAQRDVPSVAADRFTVAVDYADIAAGATSLKPRITRFPESVRVRSIEPAEVQYVIIK